MKLLVRIVLVAALVLVIAYAGVVGYMYVNQRALQYDPAGPVTALADTTLRAAQTVAIPSGDGVINGWYQAPAAGKPLIIYYKGNSGSFSEEHERFEQFAADGYGFLSFDYRGFPLSPGAISQAGILEDATNAFDWASQLGFPILIWGRSLGTGPASYVASIRDAEALLLETPFLSAATVGSERYPYLPVALVMQDQFPVNHWIVDVAEPVLVAHGTGDLTIDVSNGQRVYDLVPNKDELWIEPGAGHGDLWDGASGSAPNPSLGGRWPLGDGTAQDADAATVHPHLRRAAAHCRGQADRSAVGLQRMAFGSRTILAHQS